MDTTEHEFEGDQAKIPQPQALGFIPIQSVSSVVKLPGAGSEEAKRLAQKVTEETKIFNSQISPCSLSPPVKSAAVHFLRLRYLLLKSLSLSNGWPIFLRN